MRLVPRTGDFAAKAGADGEEDVSDASLPSLSGAVKRKKKAVTDQLTKQQEDDLCEWYKEHTFFYDKINKEYHNAEKKKAIMTVMARSLNLTYDDLQKYFASLRTQYGKLKTKRPSLRQQASNSPPALGPRKVCIPV